MPKANNDYLESFVYRNDKSEIFDILWGKNNVNVFKCIQNFGNNLDLDYRKVFKNVRS